MTTTLMTAIAPPEETGAQSSYYEVPWGLFDSRVVALTVRLLEAHGTQVSEAHREALLATSTLLTEVAEGRRDGRFVADLPTGTGKTTLLVCWAKTAIAEGLDRSVAICAERVEELVDIYEDLTTGELAVPREELALWHSKEDAGAEPTFGPGQEHLYATRRILLLTHSRVHAGPEIAALLRYRGSAGRSMAVPRDLFVYDESLVTSEAWNVSQPDVAGDIERVMCRPGYSGPEVDFLGHLGETLRDQVVAQASGEAPSAITLPYLPGPVLRAVSEHGSGAVALRQFLRNPDAAVRPLVISNDARGGTLIRTCVRVPDELTRMVILDASHPVRSLVRLANRNLPAAVRIQPGIVPRAVSQFKRFDHVTIHLMHTRRSGRAFVSRDIEEDIAQEVALVVASLPEDEAVLIWTFKGGDGLPDFSGLLREALVSAGVNIGAMVQVNGLPEQRIRIDTFGRETATNRYRHCTNVIFTGCLEPDQQTLAGQYIAESRDLVTPVDPEDLARMVRGEVFHRTYQAMSRGSMRGTFVDADGLSQAMPMSVWLFSRHQDLQEELGAVLPGAQWNEWVPRLMRNAEGRAAMAAKAIREALGAMGAEVAEITIRALKARVPSLKDVPDRTFQRARDMAVEGSEWAVSGSRFSRQAAATEFR